MIELMSQEHQDNQHQYHQQGQSNMNLNQDTAAAMLRAAQQAQANQNAGAPFAAMAGNPMAAMMFQQQQQQQQMQQQQQPQQQQLQQHQMNMGHCMMPSDQQNLQQNTLDEIKRIQQLQQLQVPAVAPSNALLFSGSNRGNDPSAFLQSMFDQHKVNMQRFDNPLAQNLGGGMSGSLLQPSFLQDARLLMAQNQLNAAQLQARQEIPLPSPHSLFHRDGSRRMRGGVIEPFPEKLHRLLTEVEAAGRSDVISFVANGRAFAIHKPDKFFKEIVPLYFRQSRLSSFKRQLNLYGFELINSGPARGGYFHELFVKDHPEMCRRMRRVAVKVSNKDKDKDGDSKGGDDDSAQGDDKKSKDNKTDNVKSEV